MSPVFPAQRRAEAFQSRLEGAEASSPRDAELLELVGALRSVAPVEPRPDFVLSLRERLVAAAATELVAQPAAADAALSERLTVSPRRSARDRRLAAALGGLAIVGGTTSMAMAAQSALPGDVLYPVKRVIEDAHTSVARGDDAKGTTLLENASSRLDETSALSAEGGHAAQIRSTLEDFADQSGRATDLLLADYASQQDDASISALRDFVADSLRVLDRLAPTIPDDAREALVAAGTLLTSIDAQATQACPTCQGSGIDRFPTWLARSSADIDKILRGTTRLPDSASVTPVQGKPGRGSTKPGSTPSLPSLGLPSASPSTGSGGTGSTSGSGGSLIDLPGTILGSVTPSPTSPSTSSSDPLQGVVDGLGDLLDPDGDGVLGGLPPKSTK